MAKNLLIVESPAKAKTIEKFLGKDFKVKSSYGHIRDLDKGDKGIDIDNGFTPSYVVSPEKKKVVSELKKAAKTASTVWLATDEDREGEAISWHLCEVLGLDVHKTNRIVFREITKPAITKAVENPRRVDLNLFNAQQARRILDRLVGFELSEVLWKKVKGKLSAGRVQSVAVKLIVERERQIIDFKAEPFFRIDADFQVTGADGMKATLKAKLKKRLEDAGDAEKFLQDCLTANFKIADIEKRPLTRKPAPPFTTSTLQQEASRKMGFGVKRTMSVAQKLYEAGHITYMRTDSISLSKLAIGTIAQAIKSEFGEEYHQIRTHKSKSSNAQEAHEAIRPTYVDKKLVSSNRDEQRLYDLIWKRTVASQMANAKLEKTVVKIGVSTRPDDFLEAEGEVIKFDGFLKLYIESKDDDEEDDKAPEGLLPPLNIGQATDLQEMRATQSFTRPPARYTEASLVKKLEELGIGRPSTYAPTISKIMEVDRGYVTKESREGVQRAYEFMQLSGGSIHKETKTEVTGSTSNRLYASDMGMIVVDFLNEHFEDIMRYGFTAEIENKLDNIATGDQDWVKMLKDFYFPFHDDVVDTTENAERASGERILGKDPKSGRTLLVRMARFGPVAQIGTQDELAEDEKPQYSNLLNSQNIESITYDEALELFKLPRTIGEYKGEELIINTGRYGPYVKYKEIFANLGRQTDPLEVDYDQAVQVLEAKLKELEPVGSYKGVPYTKGVGRFGPFLKYGDLYVNVSKKYDFDNLTQDEAHELIAAKLEKEANRYIQQWPKDKLALENGRWGPFIRWKKKSVKLPKEAKEMEKEELAKVTVDQVKDWVNEALPGSFKAKKKKS